MKRYSCMTQTAVSMAGFMQALVTSAFQADQHMRYSAWLGKLEFVPGLQGAALQQALFSCIANTANCPTSGQGWRLLSRPLVGFAVALLEKGNVSAAELADALSGDCLCVRV